MFSQYDSYVADEEKGLYSKEAKKGGGFEKELRWDAEMNVVCEVVKLRTGQSKNKRSTANIGRPYFAATMKVVKVNFCEGASEIGEGSLVSQFNWLPRGSNPEFMSAADSINLREVFSFGDAVMGFENGTIQTGEMDQLIEDDGARAAGRKIGVRTKASVSSDGRTFYNPEFYVVDQETLKKKAGIPTEKVKEMRENK